MGRSEEEREARDWGAPVKQDERYSKEKKCEEGEKLGRKIVLTRIRNNNIRLSPLTFTVGPSGLVAETYSFSFRSVPTGTGVKICE